MKINVPNQITLGRLVLALGFFVLLALFEAENEANLRWLLLVSFWVFLVAALSDVLDGLLARWLNQVTSFGRVIDPVVDKVMVCGAFVFFAGANFVHGHVNITGVQPWMVIVILIRELLVSGIRAHAEAEGQEFAATRAGKFKMFVQSTTVLVILGQLGWNLKSLEPLRIACVWLTVIVTALSIVTYVRRAHTFLLTGAALGGRPPTAPNTPAEPRPTPPEEVESTDSSGGVSA